MRWGGQGEAGRTAAAALLALASAGLSACVDKADQPRPVAQGDPARGLAVIEASNTTLFLPREWKLRIDEHDIYWIKRKAD